MNVAFPETSKDLLTRIDIHQRYGGRDIDRWMMDWVKPKATERILDLGCGSGKQCFLFRRELGPKARITGADASEELLDRARVENDAEGFAIELVLLDFNQRLPFPDDSFDLISCCFALYYARDVTATLAEIRRVLAPRGRFVATGPLPDNKRIFYELISQAVQGRPLPVMPGSPRYGSVILDEIRKLFSSVEIEVFENPLTFTTPDPFLSYTRASLSEDRRQWSSLLQSPAELDQLIAQLREIVTARIAREGQIVMTKVVGGFLASH